MATSVGYNKNGVHSLEYDQNEAENENANGNEKSGTITVSNCDDRLVISLYTKVPEEQANVTCEEGMNNHVTWVEIPKSEGIELAKYFRQVAEMLEGTLRVEDI